MWKREREAIVMTGNRAKFTQNPELRDQLLAARGTMLVEASPYAANDPRAQDGSQWKGQNPLGKILTTLRDELVAQ